MNGILLSFEGIDFCGKDTQIKLLERRLLEKGYSVHVFREPGSTSYAEVIRQILLTAKLEHEEKLTMYSEMWLFEAARSQLFGARIKKHISDGQICILNRSKDSTVAYQGYGRLYGNKEELSYIKETNKRALDCVEITRTYLIDISVDEMVRRRSSRKNLDRMEAQKEDFFERVRQGYLAIAKEEQDRVIVIDGIQPINLIEQIIRQDFDSLISRYCA